MSTKSRQRKKLRRNLRPGGALTLLMKRTYAPVIADQLNAGTPLSRLITMNVEKLPDGSGRIWWTR